MHIRKYLDIYQNIIPGCSLSLDSYTLKIIEKNDYIDECGHGTCCAEEITRIAPNCSIVPIKIFGNKLVCNSYILYEAIKRACDFNPDIINISAGVINSSNIGLLEEACSYCLKKGVIIIAAESNDRNITYPAYFSKVIGVRGLLNTTDIYDYRMINYSLFSENISIAVSGVRIVENSIIKNYIKFGSSFATARITGIVANIMQQYNTRDFNKLNKILNQNNISKNKRQCVLS